MNISGWGNYPVIDAQVYRPADFESLEREIASGRGGAGVARGLGRSYGDSSLAEQTWSMEGLDQFLSFDETTGILRCAAGVSFASILDVFVPRGWFIPVTPGTKFVTVGGAIASDVHGKNHHLEGTFCDHVESFRLLLADGSVVRCSPTENEELFLATNGGMGLTGIILDATFRMKKIQSSSIRETTFKAANLSELFRYFDDQARAPYSVAWIDCLATGFSMGRSLLMIGEHEEKGVLRAGGVGKLSIPFNLPSSLLNSFTISAFNSLYYNRVLSQARTRSIHYEPFFYPLDSIHHWNRMYGKKGFTQYQFVLPKAAGLPGMAQVLRRIAGSKKGSFLAVLKAFGPSNRNLLSFPIEGYTLALDFKIEDGLFPLLDELDRVVLDHGGRVYLSKDARMSEETFKLSYPNWEQFVAIRKKYGAGQRFASLQSKRLGI